jgi:DNA-directed RNA polymerase beta subunit
MLKGGKEHKNKLKIHYSLSRYISIRVNSNTLLLFNMPKLIRKPKNTAEPVKEKITNNNNNDEKHDIEDPPKYEDLNPRYATYKEESGASAEIEPSLKERISGRIGNYIEEPWTIIGSYFEGKHLEQLVRHQIESYNDMVNVQLKRTVDMFNPVKIASEQDYDKTTHKYRLEVEVNFTNLYLSRPQIHENTGATKILFPQEARLRNFTYASMMTVDMNVKYIVRGSGSGSDGNTNDQHVTIHHKVFPKIQIGKMPIMLKSCICVLTQHKHLDHNITGECPYDAGGYFIINGSEKTVLGQERAAENKVLCYNVSKNNNKWRYVAEIKSIPDSKCISPKQINMMVVSKQNGFGHPLVIQIPRMKQPIPLFIVFRALGVLSDQEICEYIVYNIDGAASTAENHTEASGGISAKLLASLQASIIDANGIMTQEDAVRYFTSQVIFTPMNMDKESGAMKKREFAQEVLHNDLFPHCNTDQQRIFFLGYMAHKLLCAFFEINKQDDRDSYLNKRVDLTGALLNNLFRNYFNKLVKDMSKQVVREINTGSWRSTEDYLSIINDTNMYKIIKSTTIENGLKRALSTGDFGIKSMTSNKVGVAQVLNRLTYSSSLSHLRRLNTPIDKSGKLVPPRKLHNTSWGFLCPAETPEGGSIGVVKNISYLSHVTIHSNPASLHAYIDEYIERLETLKPRDTYRQVKVFVNGTWVGITRDPLRLYREFKLKKLRGIINIYTSVVFDYPNAEIRICNDAGRMMRPLLLVNQDKNELYITRDIIQRVAAREIGWDDLLTHISSEGDDNSHGVIEYIDPDEQAFSMIAMRPHHLYRNETDTTNPYIYKYSHCEIHPSTIFGVLASCIPFPEHNQAPRNTYQCLDIHETVQMSDGRRVAIKDVKIGDEVMTYHPTTFEISKTHVVNHFIQENTHPVYKITTISGREIIATEDHKFSTNAGWKTVKEMIDNPELLVGVFNDNSNRICIRWHNIASIVPVSNRLVGDIEVASENHSFIAGDGFASSNCAMGKQAIGIYVTNYQRRMDKTAYVLTYPHRPLVDTRLMQMIQLAEIPSGAPLIVAIMSYTGYNQEDSVLVNQGAIDRGMFSATIYHTEKDEDKKINGDEEIRCHPDASKTKGMKFGNYDKLNQRGVMPANTFIENRDIIMGKVIPIKDNRNDPTKIVKYEDISRVYHTSEECYVDKSYIDSNGEGYCFCKVRVRAFRKPVIGDKVSSRMGQKGTIGNIIPERDMPFTKDGIRPDIIINPHAIPSRMTIGQLKETLLGKVLVNLGLFGDGTSFGEYDIKDISKELLKVGFEMNGNELLYNGLTGEQIKSDIFIGPVFYQRLKHMVNDKQHSRSIGPMVNFTHQPAEGRSRDGGLRFGEMERDAMVGHGASRFTKGRMYDCSDKYEVHVCRKCGIIASYNTERSIHFCKTCDNRSDFALVQIPYACKLLFQELATMNVAPRIMT